MSENMPCSMRYTMRSKYLEILRLIRSWPRGGSRPYQFYYGCSRVTRLPEQSTTRSNPQSMDVWVVSDSILFSRESKTVQFKSIIETTSRRRYSRTTRINYSPDPTIYSHTLIESGLALVSLSIQAAVQFLHKRFALVEHHLWWNHFRALYSNVFLRSDCQPLVVIWDHRRPESRMRR